MEAYNNFVFVLTYFWLKLTLEGTSLTSSSVSMSRRSLISGTPSIFCHMTKKMYGESMHHQSDAMATIHFVVATE